VKEDRSVEQIEDLRGRLVDRAENGTPAARDLAQQLHHVECSERIQSRCGLIEEENLRDV
jgi:hypothetical protein